MDILKLFKEFKKNKNAMNEIIEYNETYFKELLSENIKIFLDVTGYLPFDINRQKTNGIDTKRNNKYNQEKIKFKIYDYNIKLITSKLEEIDYNFTVEFLEEIEEFSEKKREQRLQIFLKRRDIELDTNLNDYKLKEQFYNIIYDNNIPEYIVPHIQKSAKYTTDSEYFQSKYEANFYIKYIYEIRKKYDIKLQHEYKIYDETMGKKTVDFYIPPFEKEGKMTKGLFIEVTSFNENTKYTPNYKKTQIQKNNCATKNNCNFILVTPNGKKNFDLTFVIMEDNKDKMSKEIDFKKYMKQNYGIDYDNRMYHDQTKIEKRREISLGI